MAVLSEGGGQAGTGRVASCLRVERLESLDPGMLQELAACGRQAMGDAALGVWQLPVIAAWGFLFMARLEGEIAGSAQAIRCREPGDIYMDIFYIREGYRGRGLGAAFLKQVMEGLAAGGFRRLLVTCDPGNVPAVRLFSAAGFRTDGELDAFYGPGRDRLLLAAPLAEGGS